MSKATEKKPANRGRKSKLTAELIAQVEMSLQGHNTVEATCEMLCIARETFYRWIREGEESGRGLKSDFCDTVKRAQGMSQVVLVNAISKDPSWQAKAWLLERMYPKRYGRRQLIAHAGADGESDLPAPAQPVNMTMNFIGAEKEESPWIFKEGTDPEPQNGSDPWEADAVAWEGQTTPGQSMPEPRHPLPADPDAPEPNPAGWPRGQVNQAKKPNPLDTGGRSRDPDEP